MQQELRKWQAVFAFVRGTYFSWDKRRFFGCVFTVILYAHLAVVIHYNI